LKPADFYSSLKINLMLGTRVTAIKPEMKEVVSESGKSFQYDSLLLATGADPVHLPLSGASDSQVYYLRSFDDSKLIAEKASAARMVIVIGASFIGLEVAA